MSSRIIRTHAISAEESADRQLSEKLQDDMSSGSKGRRKGSGYLYQLPSGIFQARWRDRVTKKVMTRTTNTAIRREALRKLNEFTAYNFLKTVEARAATISESYGNPAAIVRRYDELKPGMTFDEAFAKYRQLWKLKKPNTSEDSYTTYQGYLNALVKWIGAQDLGITQMRHLTRDHATAYLTALQADFDVGTYNKHLTFFKCLWNTLADVPEAKLTANPWAKFNAAPHQSHGRRELTVEELADVCASVKGEMRLLFALGIYTGLRLRDCAMLDWGSVDTLRGIIQLTPHKIRDNANARPVTIPIHTTLATMLNEIPRENRKGYVIPAVAAQYAKSTSHLSRLITRVFQRCGIKTNEPGAKITEGVNKGKRKRAKINVGFHSLRHTYVSLSANAGVPLAIVQAIVGHSSPAMTRHYFHADPKALTDAVATLPNVIDIAGAEVSYEPPRIASLRRTIEAIIKEGNSEELATAAKLCDSLNASKPTATQSAA